MRLWITGVGIVSPLGIGARVCMQRMCAGDRVFQAVRSFDGRAQRVDLVSEVVDQRSLRANVPAGAGRTEVMAIAAAREALAQASLSPSSHPVDLVFGTTTAGTFEIEERLAALFDVAPVQPLPPGMTDTLALATELIADAVGPFTRARTVSSACSTGAMSLVLAASWIRSGRSNSVLAGAADGLCRLTLTGFNALGSLDAEPCRPFDRSRAGLSLGEGAAFLVIERDDVAAARGAEPLAELAGWAAGAESHHITNPEPSGRTPTRLARHALRAAGLEPSTVDYVNAHGTATALNDPMEIQSLCAVFGDDLDRVYVSSIKGQLGHTLGAAGAIEAAVSALVIDQQRIPPTAGLVEPGDDCHARHVLPSAVDAPVRAVVSNSFGFGGLDAVLALARPGMGAVQPEPALPSIVLIGTAALGPLGLLGASDACAYLDPGAAPVGGAVPFDESLLDRPLARRLGRVERLLVASIGRAMVEAGGRAALGDPERIGLVASRLSGNPGPTAKFLAKARDRGPRFAPPADFPNLMLSSVAGHASIYHGLQGPALATADRGASGAAALLTAADLLSSGCADVMIAASADDWDICGQASPSIPVQGLPDDVPSTEGASAVVLCREDHPAAHCAAVAARLAYAVTWPLSTEPELGGGHAPAPEAGALVVSAGGLDPGWLSEVWRVAPRAQIEARAGHHDAVAGMAVAASLSAIATGRARNVLVLVRGARTGYGFVLSAR